MSHDGHKSQVLFLCDNGLVGLDHSVSTGRDSRIVQSVTLCHTVTDWLTDWLCDRLTARTRDVPADVTTLVCPGSDPTPTAPRWLCQAAATLWLIVSSPAPPLSWALFSLHPVLIVSVPVCSLREPSVPQVLLYNQGVSETKALTRSTTDSTLGWRCLCDWDPVETEHVRNQKGSEPTTLCQILLLCDFLLLFF